MTKFAKVLCAVAATSLVTAPLAAAPGDVRPSGATINASASGTGDSKRCKYEEYVDADGVTRTRSRCGGGFLFGSPLAILLFLGVAGGGVALVASSSASSGSAESP
ncbi:MAG: hypothetical protein KDE25_06060 [Novosphingobium sp.]|nr:hypothetical protein [Novosphingobium sp.]